MGWVNAGPRAFPSGVRGRAQLAIIDPGFKVENRVDVLIDQLGQAILQRLDPAPGTYNVTVFEGRSTDPSQFAKIWSGEDEPDDENTGDFAQGSSRQNETR